MAPAAALVLALVMVVGIYAATVACTAPRVEHRVEAWAALLACAALACLLVGYR